MIVGAYFKDIVLVGGGHAHALLIRRWGMEALPGVRLTLISSQPQTPYSGMLPGLIAGHYDFDQTHIDLPKLCQWAGVRFIQAKVTGLNPLKKRVLLNNRPELHYDVISIDIGSIPDNSIPGVISYSTPIKPIAGFFDRWQAFLQSLSKKQEETCELTVVGGGAGAVEIILAMAWALESNPEFKGLVKFKLVFRSSTILRRYSKSVISAAEKACKNLGITLYPNFPVQRVEMRNLLSTTGAKQSFDQLFWCTQASAPKWPSLDGLECDSDGFINVNDCLQSINHPEVFAAGDIANMVSRPIPKAGVYAVRQTSILYDNLCSYLLDKPLRRFIPQKYFLSLLALGNKYAAGERSPLAFSGSWAWRWKNSIDQSFMDKFHHLPDITEMGELTINPRLIPEQERAETLSSRMRCAGCGAKIGAGILAQVLTELTGDYQAEDASVVEWPQDSLIQSVDQLSAPIDDPFLFGRIAVFHALSDLYAMNAQAHSMQLCLTLPFAGRTHQTRELRQLLQGVLSACREEKVSLLGGHSAEGAEVSAAITVNGVAGQNHFSKQGLAKGQLLVLSKPLGVGVLLAGHMQGYTQGKDLMTALNWMNQSNQKSAFFLQQLGASCCTDVSGFGLLGHLVEMLAGGEHQAEVFVEKIPYLPGAIKLAKAGIRSSLAPQNELAVKGFGHWQSLEDNANWPLLIDPQTSGGLLAGINPEQQSLAEENGFTVIGRIY